MVDIALPGLESLTTQDCLLRQAPMDREKFLAAIEAVERDLQQVRNREDPVLTLRRCGFLSDGHRILGNFETARGLIGEAFKLAGNAPRPTIANLIRLAEIERYAHHYKRAEALLLQALRSINAAGDEAYRDFALQHLGKTYLNAGRFPEAQATSRQALDIRLARGNASLGASTRQAHDWAMACRGATCLAT